MRKIVNIVLVLSFATLFSCNDWLDVSPRSEIKASDLYKTEEGFKNALTGVYIKLAGEQLYGNNASYYFPEILAHTWQIPTELDVLGNPSLKKMRDISQFNFTDQEGSRYVRALWQNYYNAIVELNQLLEYIDDPKVEFSYGNRELIKGEALGLRAFIHLEIMRFWGPVPDGADLSAKAIPYVKKPSFKLEDLKTLSYQEVKEYILADLNQAEDLLVGDPILFNSNRQLNSFTSVSNTLPEDTWQWFRQIRFNYYAVLATKARFYHWIGGEKSEAVRYAKMVVDAKNPENEALPQFPLADNTSVYTNSDYIMHNEHVFALNSSNLQTIILPYFLEGQAELTQTRENLQVAFETAIHNDDIRTKGTPYWETINLPNGTDFFRFIKYSETRNPRNLIPMIRLSEMYFILMENLSPAEAYNSYFIPYLKARNMREVAFSEFQSETDVLSRLELEYRKEFLGEGQMFFFYKKHKYVQYTWPKGFSISLNQYVIPLPQTQVDYE